MPHHRWIVLAWEMHRGKGAYLSEGNLRYMQVINSYLSAYRAASSNQDKFQITKDIVEHVRSNGGRFMVVDGNGLTEVSQKVARQKVGQVSKRRICSSSCRVWYSHGVD